MPQDCVQVIDGQCDLFYENGVMTSLHYSEPREEPRPRSLVQMRMQWCVAMALWQDRYEWDHSPKRGT